MAISGLRAMLFIAGGLLQSHGTALGQSMDRSINVLQGPLRDAGTFDAASGTGGADESLANKTGLGFENPPPPRSYCPRVFRGLPMGEHPLYPAPLLLLCSGK